MKIVHGDLVDPVLEIASPTMIETVYSWHDVATVWLPFLAKSEGLNVSLDGKTAQPNGNSLKNLRIALCLCGVRRIPPSPPDVLNPAVRRYGAGTHKGKIVIAIE